VSRNKKCLRYKKLSEKKTERGGSVEAHTNKRAAKLVKRKGNPKKKIGRGRLSDGNTGSGRGPPGGNEQTRSYTGTMWTAVLIGSNQWGGVGREMRSDCATIRPGVTLLDRQLL